MAQEMALDRGITLNSDKIGLPSLHEDCPRSRDYETVALFRTSEQQKRAGTRDCCTFSYFRTAKASGNTRLLNFLLIHEQQNECKHRDCCNFSYVSCHFTENKRGMPPHCVRFFDPSRLKRSFFLKSAPLSTRTGDNRRQRTATAAPVAP